MNRLKNEIKIKNIVVDFNPKDIVWVISSLEYPKKCDFCNGKKDNLSVVNSKGKKISIEYCPKCNDKGYIIINPGKFIVLGRFIIKQITFTLGESREIKTNVMCDPIKDGKDNFDKRAYTCIENLFKTKEEAEEECNRRNNKKGGRK